ncbi:hypothetical protein J8281_01260 [Aquimarina sp. U1-2]|uniref:hypothetical protein n=1 Tax=Aquimarina sp. U1-2 TaxID=2823141 RepID=UPI001AED00FD|nr:hypothetical protein [Aquimarina sp. U1-2]MBP2830801.1 hypothetical protein [Aquimarina sp. U1-2]
MRYSTILVFILIFSEVTAQQQTQIQPSLENHLLKGSLLFFPSISYEGKIAKDHAYKLEVGTSPTLFQFFDQFRLGVFLKLEAQYKYYYNLKRRASKGKMTNGNSGNFINLMFQYNDDQDLFGGTERLEDTYFVGPAWGFQRTYPSGFNFLVELGIGYQHTVDDGGRPLPIIGFELGWVLFKK